MRYYALENVVYREGGDVLCVVSPVWMLKSVARQAARWIADQLNEFDAEECDVLRGSLD